MDSKVPKVFLHARMHSGPVTCLSITDEELLIGGSSYGSISIADLSSGERVASLKSSVSPIGEFRISLIIFFE